ncbi:putative protein 2 isoform X3 [Limulus polyphemus]|uniref:Secreted protein n=1 Tax=Limulus polyphemus TaxID=6850 RepID=A0ABM1SJS0_LIMPO|nr:putative protein 2 isoform X3 [Limulus polyphemus]
MNSSCIIVSFSVLIIWLSSNVHKVLGQYSDIRCKCVCPSTEVVNGSKTERNLYIGNVPPDECNCDGVVLSQIGYDLKNKEREFCPRCECHYESRNTTTIREEPVSPVTPHQSPTPTVFNRVGQQQDKWKRQVQEQRRHIYDRHTMLN